jgi:hypothetical protein
MSIYDKPKSPLPYHPDMTEGDRRRLRLHNEFKIQKTHYDGQFVDPGIPKDDGTRAINEAWIARCTRWHNRHHQRDLRKYFERMRDEQRKTNLDPAD